MGEEATEPTTKKTTLDWFLGTILSTEIEVTPALEELLKKRCMEYLMVHQSLPAWEQWVMLGQATRDAFTDCLEDFNAMRGLAK